MNGCGYGRKELLRELLVMLVEVLSMSEAGGGTRNGLKVAIPHVRGHGLRDITRDRPEGNSRHGYIHSRSWGSETVDVMAVGVGIGVLVTCKVQSLLVTGMHSSDRGAHLANDGAITVGGERAVICWWCGGDGEFERQGGEFRMRRLGVTWWGEGRR